MPGRRRWRPATARPRDRAGPTRQRLPTPPRSPAPSPIAGARRTGPARAPPRIGSARPEPSFAAPGDELEGSTHQDDEEDRAIGGGDLEPVGEIGDQRAQPAIADEELDADDRDQRIDQADADAAEEGRDRRGQLDQPESLSGGEIEAAADIDQNPSAVLKPFAGLQHDRRQGRDGSEGD